MPASDAGATFYVPQSMHPVRALSRFLSLPSSPLLVMEDPQPSSPYFLFPVLSYVIAHRDDARILQVPRDKTSVQLDLPLPLTCANIMIEFAEFHADPARADDASGAGGGGGAGRRGLGAGGTLHCPRCGRPVTDMHGVCRQCGEVAFQCCQVRHEAMIVFS